MEWFEVGGDIGGIAVSSFPSSGDVRSCYRLEMWNMVVIEIEVEVEMEVVFGVEVPKVD